MCRNQSEVTAVLNDCGDDSDEEELDIQAFEEGIPNLSRLRLAVHHKQKRVTSPAIISVDVDNWPLPGGQSWSCDCNHFLRVNHTVMSEL